MKNPNQTNMLAQDLFKLMANLPSNKSVDRIIYVFVNTINNLFESLNISFEEGKVNREKYHLEINSGKKSFGYIYFDGNVENLPPEQIELLNNAVRMLSVILDNSEQEIILNDEKKLMGHMLDENARTIYSKYEIFKTITENSPDVILVYDSGFNCLYANNNLSYIIEDIRASSLPECIDDDKINEFSAKEMLPELKRSKTKMTVQAKIIKSLFSDRCFEFRFIPAINNHKVEFIFCIGRDVTERMKIEKLLLRAKEKAQESDKLKLAFLANISHEIRTPLNGIIGFARLLNRDELPMEKRKGYIKIIESSTETLLRIMANILEISKIESGEFNIGNEKFNLNSFLLDFYGEYEKVLNRRMDKDIKFIGEIDHGPDIEINTDGYRLKEILFNLLDNAFKFTLKGFVKTGYFLKKNNIIFYVEDSGIGIRKKNLRMIFERFFQEDYSETKEYGGLGLGLTLSKAMVEKLGGKMWITSEYKKGTTIFFNLPFKPIEAGSNSETKTVRDGFVRIEK